MCIQTLPPVRQNLTSGSTTAEFIPLTGWLPAIAFDKVKLILQLVDRTTNFEVAWGLQTAATDTGSPSTPTAKGSYRSTNGKECSGLVDLSTDVNSDFYVRFGVFVKNGTGSALERGEVTLAITGRS